MKISYLILAHKNPSQFHRLVKSLNSSNTYFFVHVDKSIDDTAFKEPFIEAENIFFMEENQRRITPWSDIAISKIILTLLGEVFKKFDSNNYCVLLSGQDYPIKSNAYIYNFYKANYGKNFIAVKDITEIWPEWYDRFERYNFHLPNKRVNKGVYPFTDGRFYNFRNFKNAFYLIKNVDPKTTVRTLLKSKRKHPEYIVPKGGGTWWALPIETFISINNYLKKHPDFLEYHSFTHVPDETIFASMVNNLKEDSEIKETTTYTNWGFEDESSPATFTLNDLPELLNAGPDYLFARKFDFEKDIKILDKLDENNRV